MSVTLYRNVSSERCNPAVSPDLPKGKYRRVNPAPLTHHFKKIVRKRPQLEFVRVEDIKSPLASPDKSSLESSHESSKKRPKESYILIVSSQEERPKEITLDDDPELRASKKAKLPTTTAIALSPKIAPPVEVELPDKDMLPEYSPELRPSKGYKKRVPLATIALSPEIALCRPNDQNKHVESPSTSSPEDLSPLSSPELKKKVPPPPATHIPEVDIAVDPEKYPSEKYLWEPSTAEILEALDRKEGTLEYRNGTYEGQLYELRPHGKGTWKSDDGESYEGDWLNGEFHGQGAYSYAGGSFYSGYWKEGKREGQGFFLCQNGDTYEGEWEQNCMHGKGIGKYSRTGDFYSGQWQDNERHGKGIFFIACNRRPFTEKYITFAGEYRNNQRHGKFIITTPQGSQCELDFKDGKPISGSSRLIKISTLRSDGKENSAKQYCLDKWINKKMS